MRTKHHRDNTSIKSVACRMSDRQQCTDLVVHVASTHDAEAQAVGMARPGHGLTHHATPRRLPC